MAASSGGMRSGEMLLLAPQPTVAGHVKASGVGSSLLLAGTDKSHDFAWSEEVIEMQRLDEGGWQVLATDGHDDSCSTMPFSTRQSSGSLSFK